MPPQLLEEEGVYKAIQGRDIVDILEPLFKTGWYIDIKTQKFKCQPAILPSGPWIYVNPHPDLHCDFDTYLFNALGFLPRRCRECYKVVIRPKTVAQLIRLYELMNTEFVKRGLHCKCGVEERVYVHANYGGYQYNRGLKEGKKSYKTIRDLVDVFVGSDVGVILKRGCTEMELKTGPSKQYVVPEWADELEDKVMEVIELPSRKVSTPKYIADHTIRKWLEFAWDRGDATCLEFSDGKPIFPNKIDTYHKGV